LAFLSKSKIYLSYDLEILLLGIYSRKTKTKIYTKTNSQMFIVALFIITPNWKQPIYPSTGEWIKLRGIHIMEYYSEINTKTGNMMPETEDQGEDDCKGE